MADSPRFRSTGLPGAADLGEQRVVLHVARAELDHVGHLEHRLEVAHVHQLGHDRQAGLGLRLGQQAQARLAEALERVRRGARLVGAAAQELGAGVLDGRAPCRAAPRATRPCTGRRSWRSARRRSCRPSISSTVRSLALVLERRELVRLEDRHQVVDARRALEPEVRDVLAVADRADHGDELARRDVRLRAHGLDALDDGVDLRLRRPLFHHDHHLSLQPLKVGYAVLAIRAAQASTRTPSAPS